MKIKSEWQTPLPVAFVLFSSLKKDKRDTYTYSQQSSDAQC